MKGSALAGTVLVTFLVAAAAVAQHDHDHTPSDRPSFTRDFSAYPEPWVRTPPDTSKIPDTLAGRHLTYLIEQLADEEPIDITARMAPSFLKAVPEPQLRQTINALRSQSMGMDVISVAEKDPMNVSAVVRARADGSLWRIIVSTQSEAPHLVEGLLFQPAPEEVFDPLPDWKRADDIAASLGEQYSIGAYVVGDDGALTPIHEANPEQSLAIGSAFKLWVLGALGERTGAGEIRWDESMMVDDAHKSLPGGTMQTIAHGTDRPVSEFATKMIAISDNTATDHLLHRLGRDKVEAWMRGHCAAPERNLPFMTTKELFILKLSPDAERLQRYAAAGEEERRAILESLQNETPAIASAMSWREPRAIDLVEWFATPRDMGGALVALRALSEREGNAPLWAALSNNPGVPINGEHFSRFAFKGGSEPGVVSLNWLLERAPGTANAGQWVVLSVTVNDHHRLVTEAHAVALGIRAMQLLARQD